ncbi:protein unc-13 homolog [Camellia sinensis]|uniref:protein unc-13 homolog n=1 Tax=Camellia sinensis TaxID=4442 RepID=UPI001035E0BB|nr:protein unc-13 homolog [Camellia sinensis]XP_028103462.1 protein unc-13 homolog [Camellia sinensis]XP_028103463.1 protein unc-13 homolog [Camellia sinensis]
MEEEDNAVELLQRYRRDRRILLDFILSGSLIKKVVMPPGAVSLDDVDLDQVSVEYVLGCVKKGGMLELSEAIRDYHDSTLFPHMINNMGSTDEFFLVTNSESSGSPPKRAPPSAPLFTPSPIMPSLLKSQSLSSTHVEESLDSMHVEESLNSTQVQELSVDDIDDFEDDDDLEEVDSRRTSRRIPNDASDLALGLPSFATGVSDDDLRETAYEILLAGAGAAGGLIIPTKEKKKEKRSRFMRKLGRSKTENVVYQSQNATGLVGLLETMRVQMEISEAMDIRTRQGLLNALVGKVGKRMDTLLIPLELLCCISRTEFPDKKAYIRWQKRQLNMLEEGLLNHPIVGFGESGRKASELRILLAKIEESESLPSSTGELQRTECLRSLREICIPLAERPARGDLTGEVCHWADGYHLNVRLYEKLLLSVFDVLDEGKLTEEVEEILELLKSTWRILGITETIHYICYAWVLFRQFVITSEQGILQHAIEQLKKIPLKEQRGPQERLQLKSLLSRVEREEGVREFTFLQSFLLPIKKWADKQLGDYHLHFCEVNKLLKH